MYGQLRRYLLLLLAPTIKFPQKKKKKIISQNFLPLLIQQQKISLLVTGRGKQIDCTYK